MSTQESHKPRKPPDHLIGETLASRYLIEERLGEGAMGSVYKAKHVKVGRAFAVKVLHRNLLDDDKVAQRFERESELAGRLSHANVIGVVDVGETNDGLRYMVMDFAEGEDLANLLNEAPFPRERIVRLTRQLLEGLFHAHEAGLIHRDFKPENVIIAKDDHGQEVPRIVDFGIAILREGGGSSSSEGRLTTNGLVLGTPHYMAPEQAVADPIDHRIDLFALGIVVYEMLSGKLPFDGTGAEVARANLLLDPPPISQRVPYLEVDPLLEAFARRLMAKKRDQRPPTARDARELLDMIEKEPELAAELLGVPKHASSRVPATTQPVAPARRSADSSGDLSIAHSTNPPALAEVLPPPTSARAMKSPILSEEIELEGQRGNKKVFAIVAIAVVALLLLVILLKNSGGKKHDDVAVEVPPVAEEPPTPVEREALVVPQPPTPPPILADAALAAPIDEPLPTTPDKVVTAPQKHPQKIAPPVRPDKVTPPPEEHKVVVETSVPHAEVPSTVDVNQLYGSVFNDIKKVEDKHGKPAAAGLWQRWRNIQIQSATATPEKRAATTKYLQELHRDAVAAQP